MNARWMRIPAAALLITGARHPMINEAMTDEPGANRASTDEALARTSGCFECHAIDQTRIGPAFQDIAARYRGNAQARAALIRTVKNGGKGNWSEISHGVPMPPYSGRLTDAEVQRLVDWVLSLGD